MTRNPGALHEGDTIHIQPHDITCGGGWDDPIHITRDAIVEVTGITHCGGIVVICWGTTTTTECGAVVYDQDDNIEVVTP